jgi:hydrogenase nickel incorporation protein HypA/HybF
VPTKICPKLRIKSQKVKLPYRRLYNTLTLDTLNHFSSLHTFLIFLPMHEMSMALQIVEIATASIPAEMENPCVEKVNLKIGKLAAVVPDSLCFCFEIASKDTPLSGAKLSIEQVPIVARCKACNTQWTITEPVFTCIKCKSVSLEIISGRELAIDSIEIAD